MLIASLLKSVKHEAMEEVLFLYEKDNEVTYCRGQSLCPQQFQEFSTFRRRHHCRHCGGVRLFLDYKNLTYICYYQRYFAIRACEKE